MPSGWTTVAVKRGLHKKIKKLSELKGETQNDIIEQAVKEEFWSDLEADIEGKGADNVPQTENKGRVQGHAAKEETNEPEVRPINFNL